MMPEKLNYDRESVPQPGKKDWRFIGDLQSPIHQQIHWFDNRLKKNEADLGGGVRISAGFPDQEGILRTAYDDLRVFFKAAGVKTNGSYPIETEYKKMAVSEAYQVIVGQNHAAIMAGDTEGIRRGLFFVEEELLRRGGPFLKLGKIIRRPVGGHVPLAEFQMVNLRIEPQRLWPGYCFGLFQGRKYYNNFDCHAKDAHWSISEAKLAHGGQKIICRIPWTSLKIRKFKRQPLRFNLKLQWHFPGRGWLCVDWVKTRPIKSRLVYGVENPATDFGWLIFKKGNKQ